MIRHFVSHMLYHELRFSSQCSFAAIVCEHRRFSCLKFQIAEMQLHTLLLFGLATFTNAMLRFQCSQLVRDRLDPLVHPGMAPTPHIHQIVGGVCIFRSLFILFQANSQ
jgi:hypothetical protein